MKNVTSVISTVFIFSRACLIASSFWFLPPNRHLLTSVCSCPTSSIHVPTMTIFPWWFFLPTPVTCFLYIPQFAGVNSGLHIIWSGMVRLGSCMVAQGSFFSRSWWFEKVDIYCQVRIPYQTIYICSISRYKFCALFHHKLQYSVFWCPYFFTLHSPFPNFLSDPCVFTIAPFPVN